MKTKSPEFNDELKGQEKNRALRPLIAASLTALSMTGAYASEDLSPVVLTVEDTKGTLDQLAGQEIPNTNPVQTYPEIGSAYTLTEVQRGGDKPAGDNIITKFTYDTESKTMTPVYYKLDLKQTTYGEGDTSQPFTLTTEPVKGVEITAKYNTPAVSADRISIPYEDTTYAESGIIADFVNQNGTNTRNGGAIDNGGEISDITGDFIANYAGSGGAIYNNYNSTIADIKGDFIDNYVSGAGDDAHGGAIDNRSKIGNITGDFIGNYASYYDGISYGGAIYNSGTIGDITGDFIGNYADASSSSYSDAYGGAIYNDYGAEIGNITGDFIGNYADDYGGAIYNSGTIGDITGDFIGNYASGSSAYGGAIENYGEFGDITGDFIGNTTLLVLLPTAERLKIMENLAISQAIS